MQHVKEHRAPTRYSLEPTELREIAKLMKARGGLDEDQVRDQARHYGCATKPIYILAERIGLPVKMRLSNRTSSPRSRTPSKNLTARERAEQHFIQPPENAEAIVSTPAGTDSFAPKPLTEEEFKAAVDLLIEEEDRLRALKTAHEEEICRREEEFTRHIHEMEAKVAREQEIAREAIQQTRRLRISTRQDREELEDLRCRIRAAERAADRKAKNAEKAREVAMSHKRELLASLEREQRLLDALRRSETDLAACRDGRDHKAS